MDEVDVANVDAGEGHHSVQLQALPADYVEHTCSISIGLAAHDAVCRHGLLE